MPRGLMLLDEAAAAGLQVDSSTSISSRGQLVHRDEMDMPPEPVC